MQHAPIDTRTATTIEQAGTSAPEDPRAERRDARLLKLLGGCLAATWAGSGLVFGIPGLVVPALALAAVSVVALVMITAGK